MLDLLNIVIPALLFLAIGATFYFGMSAFRHKAAISGNAYNVGQQNARRAMQVDMLRAGFSLVVALILLGFMGVFSTIATLTSAGNGEDNATPFVPTMTAVVNPIIETETAVPVATFPPVVATEIILPSPTATAITVEQPTPIPTVTPLPLPQTAIVISEVGVWLRSAPTTSGEQIEWLLNGAELIILDGKQTADDLEWQQVRAQSGNEGWVASEFISYNE